MRLSFKRARLEQDASLSSTEGSQPSTAEEHQEAVDISEVAADLEKIKRVHQWDPNLPKDKLDAINNAVEDGDAKEMVEADMLFTEDSPYEEVRAAVRNVDGGEVANTIRAWVIGMFFVTVASGAHMFLSMRSPAISMHSIELSVLFSKFMVPT